ncbi:hypothetical protein [Streptomyces niveus]|uniref:hypothetical protein n=1 Tax=Streptomyces niveus TaxID=193462 RepID=UPI0036623EBB
MKNPGGSARQHLRRAPELGDRFRFDTGGVGTGRPGDPGADDDFPYERQQARGGCGDCGEDLGDLGVTGGLAGLLGEFGEIAQGGLAVAVRRGKAFRAGSR